jgi:xylulokinase
LFEISLHEALGLDIGSSSIKASLVDATTGESVASAQSPSEELSMIAVKPGWAEQDPETWWTHAKICVQLCLSRIPDSGKNVAAIGISYQVR